MDAPRVAGRSENPDNVRLVRDVLARPLLQTKALSRLAGIELDVFGSYFAEQLIGPPRDHHTLTICLGYSPFIEQTHGGQSRSGQAFAGEAHILPAGAGSRWQGTAPEHLSVRFQPGALGELNREADLSRSRVMNVTHALCIRDPSFRHFAALCRQELSKPSHPVQSLLIDSLASALALHFVRSYATGNCRGVDPQPTGDVRSIRRVLQVVDRHPDRAAPVGVAAEHAGVDSPAGSRPGTPGRSSGRRRGARVELARASGCRRGSGTRSRRASSRSTRRSRSGLSRRAAGARRPCGSSTSTANSGSSPPSSAP
jgi:hypothetical protein